MRVTNFHIRYFEVEDDCPNCGEVTGIDLGSGMLGDYPDPLEFVCDECGHEWIRPLPVKVEGLEDEGDDE